MTRAEMGLEDLIHDEEIVVTLTRAGYIKSVAAAAFRTQGRGGRGVQGARLKEEDLVSQVVHTSAHAYLLLFSNRGKVYRLRGHEIPMKERTAVGTAAVNLVPLAPGRRSPPLSPPGEFSPDQYLVFATSQGQAKKTASSEYDKSRREGFIAINLRGTATSSSGWSPPSGYDDLFEVDAQRHDDPLQRGRRASDGPRRGRSARHPPARRATPVVSLDVAADDTDILIVTDAGYGKRTKLERFNPQTRGGQGVRGTPADQRPVRGKVVRRLHDRPRRGAPPRLLGRRRHPHPGVREIGLAKGADATGVRVMNLDEGQTVAAVARVAAEPDEG